MVISSKVSKKFLIEIFFLAVIILGGCSNQEQLKEKKIEKDCDMKTTNIDNEVDFYGVWNIDKVVLQSKMYTGTVMDGDFEENIYDSADYIGTEVEYDPDYFRLGSEVYTNPEYAITNKTVKEVNEDGNFYNPDLYEFIIKNKIQIFNENNYEYLSEVPLLQVEVNFSKEIKYGDLSFIPVGVKIIVLNENTMLIGLWGKILLAYKT